MRGFVILVMCVWLGCQATSPPEPTPTPKETAVKADVAVKGDVAKAPGVQGRYTVAHKAGEDDALDCLSVSTQGEDLKFSMGLEFAMGHTCEMSGVAIKKGDGVWEHASAQVEGCVLRIEKNATSLVVEDAEGKCRVEFCGARGSIGHTFPLAVRVDSDKACP